MNTARTAGDDEEVALEVDERLTEEEEEPAHVCSCS
jgi:hypothetical protein